MKLSGLTRRLSHVRSRRAAADVKVGNKFVWTAGRDPYFSVVEPGRAARRAQEASIACMDIWEGYCTYCHDTAAFRVSAGVCFGDEVNLREGMVCERCGLNNRHRLLYTALVELLGGEATLASTPLYLAERLSILYGRLAEKSASIVGSEYVSGDLASGNVGEINGIPVVHQDLCGLSYERNSFGAVITADVLEHVAHHRQALREVFRVLRPGGVSVFTAPFFEYLDDHETRARLDEHGVVEHVLPPEIHGNPVESTGSLVFQNFGWKLLDDLSSVGFVGGSVGVMLAPELGFVSSNSPIPAGYMEPLVIAGYKPDVS